MTDVTGFGLVGHLLKICQSSGVFVKLELGALPLLDGALSLARDGVKSTIFEDNRKIRPYIDIPEEEDIWPLLFDPQTSGGILAAIPEEHLGTVTKKLRENNFCNAVIGEFRAGKIRVTI